MYDHDAHADPPRTFADRLRSLNDSLQALAVRLKDAIASAVSSALSQAIRDVIRRFLGDSQQRPSSNEPFAGRFDGETREPLGGYNRDSRDVSNDFGQRGGDWGDTDYGDDSWSENRDEPIHPLPSSLTANSSRWSDAFRTAIQTALWWLRTQPSRKPLLSTTLMALTAGGVALIAGPTLAACVSVVASVASLLLTADSARTAGELVSATAS